MYDGQIRKAVIPVAGLGTRLLPITKAIPKEMLPIVDRPAVHLIVEEALAAGIEQIIFITGRGKSAIEDYFDHNFELNDALRRRNQGSDLTMLEVIATHGRFSFVRQTEPLGLGHAVLCAEPFVGDEPFAVLLADDLIFSTDNSPPAIGQLIRAFERTHVSQVALMQVPREDLHRYGVADGRVSPEYEREFDIRGLEEKPRVGSEKGSHAIVGRYILSPKIWPILGGMTVKSGEELQITGALDQLREEHGLKGYCFEGTRIDAGDRIGLLHANLFAALHRDDLRDEVIKLFSQDPFAKLGFV